MKTAAVNRKRILFICTGNSCRSQMAEGYVRHLHSDTWEAWSAGTQPRELDDYAVRAMAEEQVDISRQKPKSFNEIPEIPFDYVMTLCDSAKERCPSWRGKEINLHFGFDDPAVLSARKNDEEKMVVYRRVRDLIRDVITDTLDNLSERE